MHTKTETIEVITYYGCCPTCGIEQKSIIGSDKVDYLCFNCKIEEMKSIRRGKLIGAVITDVSFNDSGIITHVLLDSIHMEALSLHNHNHGIYTGV